MIDCDGDGPLDLVPRCIGVDQARGLTLQVDFDLGL